MEQISAAELEQTMRVQEVIVRPTMIPAGTVAGRIIIAPDATNTKNVDLSKITIFETFP